MPKNLKTDWLRIGRSGKTVDGRDIAPEALSQCAKNYSKELFTALIWPEHQRYENLGTVEALKAQKNNEGGIDLFAVLAPNDSYLYQARYGQKLFTSMELMPNFRDSGEWYLTGMAATDSPASAATSEVRFSALANKDALLGQFVEAETHEFTEETPGWFRRFFEKQSPTPEDFSTMDKATLIALDEKLDAFSKKLDGVLNLSNEKKEEPGDRLKTLEDSFSALTARFDKFLRLQSFNGSLVEPELKQDFNTQPNDKTPAPAPAADKAAPPDDRFSKIEAALAKVQQEFKQALKEQPGTDAGESFGSQDDLSEYQ